MTGARRRAHDAHGILPGILEHRAALRGRVACREAEQCGADPLLRYVHGGQTTNGGHEGRR